MKSIPSRSIPPCTHEWALCLIISPKGVLFPLKHHSNWIIRAEVGSNDFGCISQASSVVNFFFPHCFHEILTIISFHCFSQMEIIFMITFCCKSSCVCKVNGSVIKVATYKIHVVQDCFKDWYIFQIYFWWFLLNLVVKFVSKYFVYKFKYHVLLRMLVNIYLVQQYLQPI